MDGRRISCYQPKATKSDRKKKLYYNLNRFKDVVGAVFNRDQLGRVNSIIVVKNHSHQALTLV
jgi:hypothetical protein